MLRTVTEMRVWKPCVQTFSSVHFAMRTRLYSTITEFCRISTEANSLTKYSTTYLATRNRRLSAKFREISRFFVPNIFSIFVFIRIFVASYKNRLHYAGVIPLTADFTGIFAEAQTDRSDYSRFCIFSSFPCCQLTVKWLMLRTVTEMRVRFLTDANNRQWCHIAAFFFFKHRPNADYLTQSSQISGIYQKATAEFDTYSS